MHVRVLRRDPKTLPVDSRRLAAIRAYTDAGVKARKMAMLEALPDGRHRVRDNAYEPRWTRPASVEGGTVTIPISLWDRFAGSKMAGDRATGTYTLEVTVWQAGFESLATRGRVAVNISKPSLGKRNTDANQDIERWVADAMEHTKDPHECTVILRFLKAKLEERRAHPGAPSLPAALAQRVDRAIATLTRALAPAQSPWAVQCAAAAWSKDLLRDCLHCLWDAGGKASELNGLQCMLPSRTCRWQYMYGTKPSKSARTQNGMGKAQSPFNSCMNTIM